MQFKLGQRVNHTYTTDGKPDPGTVIGFSYITKAVWPSASAGWWLQVRFDNRKHSDSCGFDTINPQDLEPLAVEPLSVTVHREDLEREHARLTAKFWAADAVGEWYEQLHLEGLLRDIEDALDVL